MLTREVWVTHRGGEQQLQFLESSRGVKERQGMNDDIPGTAEVKILNRGSTVNIYSILRRALCEVSNKVNTHNPSDHHFACGQVRKRVHAILMCIYVHTYVLTHTHTYVCAAHHMYVANSNASM